MANRSCWKLLLPKAPIRSRHQHADELAVARPPETRKSDKPSQRPFSQPLNLMADPQNVITTMKSAEPAGGSTRYISIRSGDTSNLLTLAQLLLIVRLEIVAFVKSNPSGRNRVSPQFHSTSGPPGLKSPQAGEHGRVEGQEGGTKFSIKLASQALALARPIFVLRRHEA